MDDQRISRAMKRIEDALARIETAGAQRPAPSSAQNSNAQLVARHEALRDQVGESLAELDALIGRMGG